MTAVLLAALGLVLLLPGRAAPTSAADPITVSVSAPANVLLRGRFDYVITATYNGELTGVT